MKKIKLPSTVSIVGREIAGPNILNLNTSFWEHFFSSENIQSLFVEYIDKYNPPDEFKSYLDFIVVNINAIGAIKDRVFSSPFEEKRALYCFKVYYFILSIFNRMNENYRLTLPYGIFLNHPIEEIERFISEKNVVKDVFDKVLESDFFKDDEEYLLQVYWENQSYVLLLLACMMRKKFKNIKINVDLGDVNEQADFSFWKSHPLFVKYVDDFKNIYYEESSEDEGNNSDKEQDVAKTKKVNSNSLSIRLFDTKCYWGKCSFCSINSRFTSEEKVDGLSKHAIQIVDKLIDDIKKMKELSVLVFTDEAIEASVLVYFAEKLLENKINIRWSTRSRFSNKFTLENCKILGKSGLRFLGFGLESVNPRVLELMNKREREYSKEELNDIFRNCDESGINAHTYFMIGFPSETKEETDETLEFVDYQLKNRKYFTYSANVFYLMKGSGVYREPEKYNIGIVDKYSDEKLSNIDFVDNNPGEKYTRNELAYLSRKAYSKMFFKEEDLDYATVQLGYDFWDFLDRTSVFYSHKMVNSNNPYLYDINISKLSDKLLDRCFYLLPLFIILNGSHYEYHNIFNERRVTINESIYDFFAFFVENFNPDITLRDNLKKCYDEFDINVKDQDISKLVKIVNKKNLFEKYIAKLITDSLLYTDLFPSDICE